MLEDDVERTAIGMINAAVAGALISSLIQQEYTPEAAVIETARLTKVFIKKLREAK